MRLPPLLATAILSAGVISALLVVPSCKKSPGASTPTADKKGDSAPKEGSDKVEIPPDTSAVGFLKAKPLTCMFHQEAQGYFRCLAGADGQCFHFGESCAPTNKCMVDVSQGVAKVCRKIVAGQCSEFGAACEKKNSCQYSPKEARYRKCEQSKSGRCTSHGQLCLPTE